jgi:Ankyrin repeats (3 copies)
MSKSFMVVLACAGVIAALSATGAASAANDAATQALQSAHPPLIRAAGARRYAEVRKLIEKGADPNERDKFGSTALELLLAREGPIDLVRLLISHGADVNSAGEHLTPLGTAIYFCRLDALPILIDEGARLDIPVGLRRPAAREFAAKFGCPEARAIVEQRSPGESR